MTASIAYSGEIFTGIAVQQSTLFIMDNDSESDLAELESRLYFAPAAGLRSSYNYFGSSSIGWFVEFNAGYYNVDSQAVGDESLDRDTFVSGLYLDLTPTLFFSFGDPEGRGLSLKTGLGLGFGFLYVNGDAVLTEIGGNPEVSFNEFAPGFTSGIFQEIVIDKWFMQVKAYGPYIFADSCDIFLVNVKVFFGRKIIF